VIDPAILLELGIPARCAEYLVVTGLLDSGVEVSEKKVVEIFVPFLTASDKIFIGCSAPPTRETLGSCGAPRT